MSDNEAQTAEDPFAQLPGYARSLLRIGVPVSVTVASKQERVSEILKLTPGSIISFPKTCDDVMEMFVGDVPVAEGDAVKVGDKFGLRITHILPPHERFAPASRAADHSSGQQPRANGQ